MNNRVHRLSRLSIVVVAILRPELKYITTPVVGSVINSRLFSSNRDRVLR